MAKVLTDALVLFILLTPLTLVFGRVVVLRGLVRDHRFSQNERKLLCVSDDDGGALIWNSNLNWEYQKYAYSDRNGYNGFRNLFNHEIKELDCDLSSQEKCMNSWDTTNWSLTDPFANPMGPVFDRRWETFQEFENFWSLNQTQEINQFSSGAIAFSIRGTKNAHILLCDSRNFESDFCFWINIGGQNNKRSVLRKCAHGLRPPANVAKECMKERNVHTHAPLSPTEWRTFVITWNQGTRGLSLYDTKELLMSYADAEDEQKSRGYHLFIRSPVAMLFRIHIYSFLHTTDSTAILTSPVIRGSATNFCIQMLIGLCAECQMDIVAIDDLDSRLQETLGTVKGLSTPYGLPMWQHFKTDKTPSWSYARLIRIKLIPKLASSADRPFWAVANIRACPPVDAVRYGVMQATQDHYKGYFWPSVTCQKLFYDESVVVNSALDAKLNFQFEDLYCPEGQVGPHCSISCKDRLDNDADCKGTVICEKEGCTCPPGFVGKDCRTNCHSNRYGHDCKETCGHCSDKPCNSKTGVCTYGCENSDRYFVPPFCKTVIETPPEPEIAFVNETSVRAVLPAKQEYKLASAKYLFIVQVEGGSRDISTKKYVEINQNTTFLVGDIGELKPGTVYWVKCLLYGDKSDIPIIGERRKFTTPCNPNTNFEIGVGERSIILTGSKPKDDLYSCPEKWYKLTLEDVENGAEIIKEPLNTLPREILKLHPDTLYKIAINGDNAEFFSREVRTPEAAPSAVRHLRKTLSERNDLTLKWEVPQYPNGNIVKYEVILVTQTYFGCKDLNLPTPEGNSISTSTTSTTIRFPGLHPYARYVAKISACNSQRGPEEKIEFSTPETDIPTAVFSNLRLENYTLWWDNPKDCTTISGPIRAARITIDGISEIVKSFSVKKQTERKSLQLDPPKSYFGAETYRARIYALRKFDLAHNDILYRELNFTTPPKAPPPVRNLEIYEVNLPNKTIGLRWQKPEPPIHGKIKHFIVTMCNRKCQNIGTVDPAKRCAAWETYVCTTVPKLTDKSGTIRVSAVNVNVSTPGTSSSVDIINYETAPVAPGNFTLVPCGKGLVNATWSHPWRPGGAIARFVLIAQLTSTDLRRDLTEAEKVMTYDHLATPYQPLYSEVLHLLSSTDYTVALYAETTTETKGHANVQKVKTSLATAFASELTAEVYNAESTISLHIPDVVNDTKGSVMYVVVKGPQTCDHPMLLEEDLRRRVDIKKYESFWLAARFHTDQYAGKAFTVGDNEVYSGATNCPLKSGESYVIMVMVYTMVESMDDEIVVAKTTSIRIGGMPKGSDRTWLLTIVLILLVLAAAFFVYRRRRHGLTKEIILQDELTLTQHIESADTKSKPKQLLRTPTPSERDVSSRASTPEGPRSPIVVNHKEHRTSLVKVKDFENYVQKIIKSGMLDRQYDTFPRGPTKPWEYGKLPQNKPKNRYGNLIAYDETRVVLEKLPNDPYSDYINANYVKGYKKEKSYIATQGPKTNTVIDFWRMIWQERTSIICMLANVIEGAKTKCEQYWPDIGRKKKYGDLVVLNVKHNVYADYTFRTLHITRGDETRKIEHLHYTTWPDHGVPVYTQSVVTYLKKLLATPPGNGPVVVHCSAGVGRTGTIILCDICLRRAAAEGVVDVFAETEAIRSQRANMVDNRQQYLLAHLALVECLLSSSTALPCNEVLPARIKELKTQLAIQQQRLQDTAWQDEALRPHTAETSLSERNLAKNRFPELVSEKVNRVYLKRYPATDEDSDYIAAVYVDGVKQQNQYLATQLPLPSTFNDFWRMVAEFKVELIVMLQPSDPLDPTCCPIIPTSGEFKPTPYINITTKEVVELEHHTSRKLLLIDNSEKPAREQHVMVFCLKDWKPGRNEDPPAVIALVTVWQATERISRGDGPTVVLCHDGVTGCGLYLALSFLLERMAVERECDVCLAIRSVRRSRPDFARSLEHMEYLYDAAIMYLEYFETYANFT